MIITEVLHYEGLSALGFLIIRHFIPIRSQLDTWQPRRSFSHLLAADLVINAFAAFDNPLIMHVSADEAVGKILHGKAEKIPAYGLPDVLDELWAVGFDVFSFHGGTDASVDARFTDKFVFANTRFYIA